ncbi:hypothetical protein [Rhodoferax antarcticus]|uniref:Uncharacterized protein n=1 Tax=Rhodoferax antarcticus ANT.BR TaxID=1111071 RepID=A0A1Q8YIJ2_9BURK|nr:hypothetical protein [Rhodoferax antarcticus]OLP07797.1 hypothetical protein BLL52_0893 [Rhodoferax antarcticus ANT.BR]
MTLENSERPQIRWVSEQFQGATPWTSLSPDYCHQGNLRWPQVTESSTRHKEKP